MYCLCGREVNNLHIAGEMKRLAAGVPLYHFVCDFLQYQSSYLIFHCEIDIKQFSSFSEANT